MILKNFNEFNTINESKIESYKGNFKVTKEMVNDGIFISDLIPNKVYGDFDCSSLDLTTLEGGPNFVQHTYYCSHNELTNLKYIGNVQNIYAHDNKLISLEGCPQYTNILDVDNNKLTSLKGGPNEAGEIQIEGNPLINLEGNTRIIDTLETDNNIDVKSIEFDFIQSDHYLGDSGYYLELAEYCIDNKIPLEYVESWDDNFYKTKLGKSVKSITKYNL